MTEAHRELWRIGGDVREDNVAVPTKKRTREQDREYYRRRQAKKGCDVKGSRAKWRGKTEEIAQWIRERGIVSQSELGRFIGYASSVSFVADLGEALCLYEDDDGSIGLLE
jgi:hypothetical protein